MRVAVTGAGGELGSCVLDRLAADPGVEAIIALDRRRFAPTSPKVEFRRCDVRAPDIHRHFEGCRAVVHLAFIVERGSRNLAAVEEVCVGGTRNVCAAAAGAGVTQILIASSIAAYGIHPENAGVVLTEDAPIRGNPEFYYSRFKAEVESWLDEFEREHPQIRVTRLRPTHFVGEKSERAWAKWLGSRVHFYPTGLHAPLYLTHVEDVAEAFALALEKRARGAFNIATADPLPVAAMGRVMGKWSIPIPRAALRLYALAYRMGLGSLDPAWLEYGLREGLLVSSEKARRELGWEPRHPTTGDVMRRVAARPRPADS